MGNRGAGLPVAARDDRFHNKDKTLVADQRRAFERDRDRILHSSAFHRLAGITQIVRAGELDIFHTRQQHTYKVAQIGRRIAQHRLSKQDSLAKLYGLDAEVVEGACLAHDIGHPPFGHAAEKKLDYLVRHPEKCGGSKADAAKDGYEGNAQTFRILTKLAVRWGTPGLDLTRATLAATLKYPWLRDLKVPGKDKKWSAYATEKEQFLFAREGCTPGFKTAEAELMDWADDIAYSVHDLEDFHRVGIIPWAEIVDWGRSEPLLQGAEAEWKKDLNCPRDASSRLSDALERITRRVTVWWAITDEVYSGSREQRRQLRNFCSSLIGHYVRAASLTGDLDGPAVVIQPDAADEVRLLKYFARNYVLSLPALHAQQYGQAKIIEDLFGIFLTEGKTANFKLFPKRLLYIWEDNQDDPAARLAADCVASLTENEAIQLHSRLTGTNSGLILDPIVR